MTALYLSASIEVFAPGGRLEPGTSFATALYVIDGSLRADGTAMSAALAENSAVLADGATRLTSRDGATAVRWDLSERHEPSPDRAREAVAARPLLSATLDLDPRTGLLLRCDRVAFPPGGVAYLHTHRGPGIRVLLSGSIRIETAGTSHDYGPLEAWYESGPEPVFAAASPTEPTAFVRVMILPTSLIGQSSIRYVREEDRNKPKPQRYQIYLDRPL
jgi:quercetin dioxygenase-like cupin family protein